MFNQKLSKYMNPFEGILLPNIIDIQYENSQKLCKAVGSTESITVSKYGFDTDTYNSDQFDCYHGTGPRTTTGILCKLESINDIVFEAVSATTVLHILNDFEKYDLHGPTPIDIEKRNILVYFLHNVVSLFPVTEKLLTYTKYGMGFLGHAEMDAWVTRNSNNEKTLTADGYDLVQKFISDPFYRTMLNTFLGMNYHYEGMLESVKVLKACIGWNSSKPKGNVYVPYNMSPIELIIMASRKMFYLPSFLVGYCDINNCGYEELEMNYKNPEYQIKHNLIFEIDCSIFNEFTSTFKDNETGKMVHLISCYNIFKWEKVRIENNVMVVTLSIQHYHSLNDCANNMIKEENTYPADISSWLRKRGTDARVKEIKSTNLSRIFTTLLESWNRNYPNHRIDWLNYTN